jgi:REP element-mobilizing transposase RayT
MSVIAYHLIWTVYGTWLGNDPRGSGSRFVYTPELAELGDVHFGRKKVQPRRSEVREYYHEAEPRLAFPVIRFDDVHNAEIGRSFAATIDRHRYTCYASAIMPDHVHLVIRKHRDLAEQMIATFQGESRAQLFQQRLVPSEHPVLTKNGWNVFLDTPASVRARIRYVEENPVKASQPRQAWPFVTPYDGWPFS